jgi:hypothetical protein
VQPVTAWRKSSYSAQGDCVGVARHPGCVLVRDMTDEIGPVIPLSDAEWRAFLDDISDGKFDRPKEKTA